MNPPTTKVSERRYVSFILLKLGMTHRYVPFFHRVGVGGLTVGQGVGFEK